MTRVASLYLPQLAIERLRRSERPVRPLEPRAPEALLPSPVDDDPGACSVPRGGDWRPGARWASDGGLSKAQVISQMAQLPAHQRPPMRIHIICDRITDHDDMLRSIGRTNFSIAPGPGDGAHNGGGPDPRDPSFPRGRTLASPPFGAVQEQEAILPHPQP